MSLHVLANHMSSKGRNGDSMLVHMTPHEVAGLQALAMKHGGSLTINPDTGLPEANFLKSLLPMIAGFALNAFVPGLGSAIGGALGTSAAVGTGIAVGGITGLATGSLSKGLMAGLGAYGGAGLGEGLASAGAASGAGQALATEAASQAALEGIQLPSDYASLAAKTATPDQIAAARAASTSSDLLSAGAKSAAADPMAFAKANLKPLAAAASPIMADMMVPTTTKAPTNINPAYIRQYVTGDRPQAPRALAPVLASEWGARNFSDAYNKPMAGGGIVALADGGDVVRMAAGTPPVMLSDEDLYQKTGSWKAAAAARDAQNNALNQYNWNQAQQAQNPALIQQAQANAVNTQNALTAAKDYVTTAATPTTTTDQFVSGAMAKNIGLTQELQTALANSGLSAAAQYALTHANIGPDVNKEETYGGLKGLSSNINYLSGQAQDQISKGTLTGQQARENALTEMNKYGINDADIFRATGKTLKELFPDTTTKVVTPTPFTSVVPGGTQMPGATVYDNGAYGNYGNNTGNPLTSTPGDIITNPDNSRTVTPNTPGRPYGGFTGIENLKSAYTAGGGSLGYTPYIPTTPEEHDKLYNTQGSDSLAAYNYLIGKGAGTPSAAKYPIKSVASEIAKPYEEAVLGYPTDITKKKYINVDGKMVLNPNYVAPKTQSEKTTAAATAAKAGKPSTISVIDSSGNNTETITAVLQNDGTYLGGNGKKYDASGKELAAMGGMMGYAVGGGLGSLGSYSDGGRLLKGPGDGVSDSIPATIGAKGQPARLADGEFVVPARIVSELGNGSTEAGARKLYAMMDRVQKARGKTTGKNRVAANTRADKYLPA